MSTQFISILSRIKFIQNSMSLLVETKNGVWDDIVIPNNNFRVINKADMSDLQLCEILKESPFFLYDVYAQQVLQDNREIWVLKYITIHHLSEDGCEIECIKLVFD